MKKLLFGATLLIFIASPAYAAGFYLQEQSVKGLGMAFAGSTTSINDASTIYFNPAGMTDLEQGQIHAGVNLMIQHGDISDTGSTFFGPPIAPAAEGNPYDPIALPNLYAAYPFHIFGKEIWGGLGVSLPFGITSDYGGAAFNRFDATETELNTINLTPALAVDITDMLSVGAGLDIQYAEADLRAAFNAGTPGTTRIKGDDISYGFNIGLQIEPVETTKIGLHYRSAISHELDGRIINIGTGLDTNEPGTLDLDLPDIATIGIGHDVNDRMRIMGQVAWFGWDRFNDIDGNTDAGVATDPDRLQQNYDDTFAFAVGGEYDFNPQWTFRVGYQYDQTPTNDQFRSTRNPDGDRHQVSAGGTYKLTPNLELDFAASYTDIGEETVNVARNFGGNAIILADTEGYIANVAAAITWKF
ncbi:MAG: OmpP1/FadL family transporter [Pseudomonadota bacterium]